MTAASALIYLDYQSTTPCAPEAIEAMLPYFGAEKFGNPHAAAHANGRAALRALEDAKAQIGALAGAAPETVTLTSGATEANALALLGTAQAAREEKNPRNEIIIGALEHASVRETAFALEKSGCAVKIAPATHEGVILPQSVQGLLTEKTLLVSVMAANHELGTVQPIADIARMARAEGALFHTDAAQAAGKMPLDMAGMGIDMLSFCSHKIYGPCGIGALCVRQKPPVALARFFFGGAQQFLRPGTVPLALAVGFASACTLARKRGEEDAVHQAELCALFLEELEKSNVDFHVNGQAAPRLAGVLSIRFAEAPAEDILLETAGALCLSTGAACASLDKKPSSVLSAIGLTDEEISQSLRLSFGRMSTREDALRAARVLSAAASRVRAAGLERNVERLIS